MFSISMELLDFEVTLPCISAQGSTVPRRATHSEPLSLLPGELFGFCTLKKKSRKLSWVWILDDHFVLQGPDQ